MTDADLVVTGGQVYVHGQLRDVTLGVTDGRVSHLAAADGGLSGDRELDVDGSVVLPGCVDAHVHVRPGDDREGVDSATAAAAAGGVTTVVDMPNFPPTVTDREVWDEMAALYDGTARVDYSMFGHIAEGQNVGTGDITELAAAGAPAFKTFTSAGGGPDPYVVLDKGDLLTAFEEVAETGRPFWVHAEDDEYHVEFIERVEEEGLTGMDAFLESAPPILEATAVRDLVDLADYTGVTTVIAHTTTAEALDIVADAQADGVPIYAETTPYYLGIDAERLRDIGTTGLGTPPVRSPANRERIWERFDDGRVDTMATDHAPASTRRRTATPSTSGRGCRNWRPRCRSCSQR
ncbi:amidohydrolase family protein [Haloarculaceae archaeon H-GB2-1]|nr:amidohydrolase family protein [Haloarculaceae archaeon H-GB11]MEA5409412.1 amidohydrolase family protein [Haloarculaceae archaeon H-GB2-1]